MCTQCCLHIDREEKNCIQIPKREHSRGAMGQDQEQKVAESTYDQGKCPPAQVTP
jgi:hypothetical protein